MAQLDTNSGGGGKGKQKKMNARVDFTPMVDMIMLLVTFFMLCTTLIKPQTMEISMPSDKEDISKDHRSQVAASKAVTIYLDENDAIYYFEGKPSEAELKATTYGKAGIREVLLAKNVVAQKKVEALKKEFAMRQSSNPQQDAKNKEEYKERLKEIKNGDDTPNVIIKATEKASYKNLIDILDEMQICTIGRYVIDKFSAADAAKIAEYKAKNGIK